MENNPIDWQITIAPSEKKLKRLALEPQSPEALKNIAEWLNIEAITKLDAQLELMRKNAHQATLSGKIKANITQLCVLSLEPIHKKIHVDLHCHFTTEEENLTPESEIPEEDTESWDGKNLDLGRIILEELLLHIDLYPKKDNVILDNVDHVETSMHVVKKPSSNPFEVLKKLQKNDKES